MRSFSRFKRYKIFCGLRVLDLDMLDEVASCLAMTGCAFRLSVISCQLSVVSYQLSVVNLNV